MQCFFNKNKYRDFTPVDSVVFASDVDVKSNTKVIRYPTGDVKVTFSRSDVFKSSEWEACQKKSRDLSNSTPTDPDKLLADSVHRSYNKVFDIFFLNTWDYYFTGTLSEDCGFDRYNPDEVCKYVNKRMYNLVYSGVVERYIFVPEFHKDKAVHFHGFIKFGSNLDKSTIKRAVNPNTGRYIFFGKSRQPVYNWESWHFGFTTIVPIFDVPVKACRYILKYVTKSFDFPCKHRYYCGGSVIRIPSYDVYDIPFDIVPLNSFKHDFGAFKYFFGSSEDFNNLLSVVFDTLVCAGGD